MFLWFPVLQCLESFVQRGPDGYAKYCTERLSRIKSNGERKEVPCWLEIKVQTLKHHFSLVVMMTLYHLLNNTFHQLLEIPSYWTVFLI